MWAWIARAAATRAATGWALALGLAVAGTLWYAYDSRGDRITELKLDLSRCEGNQDQADTIDRLAQALGEQAQEHANETVERIEDLPNDCYFLDDSSPLNRVRGPQD